MTYFIAQSGTSTSTTVAPIALGSNDKVLIGAAVTIGSQGYRAIHGTSVNHEVMNYGTVAGSVSHFTVFLGVDGNSFGQILNNKAGAFILQLGFSGIAQINGFQSTVLNAGTMEAKGYGIFFAGLSTTTQSVLNNSGTLFSGYEAIRHTGTEQLAITNTGSIASRTREALVGADSIETFTNSGRVFGAIDFAGGNDVYSGASGRLTGKVFGDGGNDTITGGIDADWFEGGTENDTLRGNGGNDRLYGQDGTDRLYGGVGNDTLHGGTGVDTIYGDTGNDTIKGDAGADKIWGGAGLDRLYGGADRDIFVFNSSLASANRDVIYDFNRIADTIQLENAVFKKVGANGTLKSDAFKVGTRAADAEDRIIYNKATGALFYDADGTGSIAAIQFATLANKVAITSADFVVI